MQTPLVITVIGRDRPGLVEAIARLVAEHGGNWLESRMCRLGGEFAGILRVQIPSAQRQRVVESLDALRNQGLTVVTQPDTPVPSRTGVEGTLDLVGQDRPGIVRQISHILAEHGVNVEELTTECCSAPMSGETLFTAKARLLIPETCDVNLLKADLERIAADLQVELRLATGPKRE